MGLHLVVCFLFLFLSFLLFCLFCFGVLILDTHSLGLGFIWWYVLVAGGWAGDVIEIFFLLLVKK